MRWVHSHAMIADGLTKPSNLALNVILSFLRRARWKIVHDERFLSARKRAPLEMYIFQDTSEGDPQRARDILEERRQNALARKERSTSSPGPLERTRELGPQELRNMVALLRAEILQHELKLEELRSVPNLCASMWSPQEKYRK